MSLIKLIPVFVIGLVFIGVAHAQSSNSTNGTQTSNDVLIVKINTDEGQSQTLILPANQLLFNVIPHYDDQENQYLTMQLKPDLSNTYHEIGLLDKPKDIVFVYPIFTQAAYGKHGFYDHYRGQCDTSCLTVHMPDRIRGTYSSSITGAFALKLLQYPHVTDEDIDKNPDILKQYKEVIILHNEYVTKKEFDAITSHPNVIFLYPNALYAQVNANYTTNTITLIRGHGYPDQSIRNGFDWKYDNSKYEYNVNCDNMEFYRQANYSMANCYPEYKLLTLPYIYNILQDTNPTDVINDTTEWIMQPNQQSAHEMLEDYNINATHIPHWITFPAIMTLNGNISKSEFFGTVGYLYDNKVIH